MPRSAIGFACPFPIHVALPILFEQRKESDMRERNVGDAERTISGLLGAGMLTLSARALVRRRPIAGAVLAAGGLALLRRGVTGQCALYDKLGIDHSDADATSNPLSRHVRVTKAVTINASPEQLYQQWRRLQELPSIMSQLKSVEVIDDKRSRWTAQGPMNSDVTWNAEITRDEPNRRLAWRSTGGDVEMQGEVEFMPHMGDRGCIVRVSLDYRPPAGAVGALVAKIFRSDPKHELDVDLRQFKQLMETGEISTGKNRRSEVMAPRAQREPIPAREINYQRDPVDEAVLASFPASDPPAWAGQ